MKIIYGSVSILTIVVIAAIAYKFELIAPSESNLPKQEVVEDSSADFLNENNTVTIKNSEPEHPSDDVDREDQSFVDKSLLHKVDNERNIFASADNLQHYEAEEVMIANSQKSDFQKNGQKEITANPLADNTIESNNSHEQNGLDSESKKIVKEPIKKIPKKAKDLPNTASIENDLDSETESLYPENTSSKYTDTFNKNDLEVEDQSKLKAVNLPAQATQNFDRGSEVHTEIDTSIVNNASANLRKDRNIASNQAYLYTLILIICVLLLVSILTSFYLYRWRKILLADGFAAVPEDWVKAVSHLSKKFEGLNKTLHSFGNDINQSTKQHTAKIDTMTQTYMELQSVLDTKEAEISRLKKGYDSFIFEKFLKRFIKIDNAIDDLLLDSPDSDELKDISTLFEDAFAECNVYKFSPNVGEDYRDAFGVSEHPKFEITIEPSKEFLIAEVLESGFLTKNSDKNSVIIPAKVKIYKLQ